MPTTDPTARLRRRDVRDVIASAAFGPSGEDDQRGIGLEIELFGLHDDGDHARRLTIAEQAPRLDAVSSVGARTSAGALAPWPAGSGTLSFEPGAQLEYSSGVHHTAAAAMTDQDAVLDALAATWAIDDDLLVGVGHDLFGTTDDVTQQLFAPRYEAMDDWFGRRGGVGRRMMRNTCALQINLDPGQGDEAERRWWLANLAAPLVVATFASSPAMAPDPAVSVRARIWRQLDATRTGIVGAAGMGGPHDRISTMTAFALAADVMMLHAADGSARTGTPGRTFAQWLTTPDDELGWPTEDDLRRHLSTLFPEVRPRGPLEIRSIDALPRRWRAVPVVLLTGLLYDEASSREGLRLLRPRAGQLATDLVRAGEGGLKDPELCAAAVEIWSLALSGAMSLGTEWHRLGDLRATEDFIDHFTMRGLSPADEIRGRVADDALAAMRWLAEPASTSVRDRR